MLLALCGLGPLPGGLQADGPSCTHPEDLPLTKTGFSFPLLQAWWEIRGPHPRTDSEQLPASPGPLCSGSCRSVPKGKGRGDRARGCCVGGGQGGKACVGGEGRWWWGALVNSNPAPGAQGRPHLPLKRERFKGERLRCVCARPPVRPPPVCAPVAVIADVPPLSLRCSRLAHTRPSPPAPLRGSLCPSLSSSGCH